VMIAEPAVRRALKDSPALHREAIGVLGAGAPALIADALDRFGLDSALAEALVRDRADEVAGASDVVSASPANTAHSLASLIRANRLDAGSLDQIAGEYSGASERLAAQVLKRR
jgi:hypothetical protein